jgi:hypothetical protein
MNQICNGNKHMEIFPVDVFISNMGGEFRWTNGAYVDLPHDARWDRAKQEFVIAVVGPNADFKCKFKVEFSIAFGQIEIIAGKPAAAVLNAMATEVERVIVATESEARRLFPNSFE